MSNDEWRTPEWLWGELNEEFNFGVDLCAVRDNAKCKLWCHDYLNTDLIGSHFNDKTCFMNPPYSNPYTFIEKAWADSKYCKIVCLVKCDPSTKWWSIFWNYGESGCRKCGNLGIYGSDAVNCPHCRGPKPGCEVRYFPKRIKFDPPLELKAWKEKSKWKYLDLITREIKELSGPSFSSCLLIFDRRGLGE